MSTVIYDIYKYEGEPERLIHLLNEARVQLKEILFERMLECLSESFGVFQEFDEKPQTHNDFTQEQWAVYACRQLWKDVKKQNQMNTYYDESPFWEYLVDFINSVVIYTDGDDIYLHLFGGQWGINQMISLLHLDSKKEICHDNRTDDKSCNEPDNIKIIQRLIPDGRFCDHGLTVILSNESPLISYRWEDDDIKSRLKHSIDAYFKGEDQNG